MWGRVALLLLTALLVAWGDAKAMKMPVAVSPGSAQGSRIGDSCPTFSWTQVPGAARHELVLYRVGRDDAEADEVFRQSVPAGAGTWTPPLDRCLEPGSRYAWSVRALDGEATSGWSKPSLFQVAREPSRVEIEAALRIVETYLEGRDRKTGGVTSRSAARPGGLSVLGTVSDEAATAENGAGPPRAPTLPGPAVFQSEIPSTDMSTKFGVLGLANSTTPQSAGVYGEVTDENAPVSFGLLGIVSNFESWAVAGLNETTQTTHKDGFHGVGVIGQTGHSDGPGVVGVSTGAEGIGVAGIGDIGVKGVSCSPGSPICASGTGVFGKGRGTSEYGGFFANLTGDLIGAENAGDTANPTFRVDNDGDLTAQNITAVHQISATSFDMDAFAVRKDSLQAAGSSANSPSCTASELRTGGGCECLGSGASSVISRPEGTDFWRCECASGTAKAWVVCLGSPTM